MLNSRTRIAVVAAMVLAGSAAAHSQQQSGGQPVPAGSIYSPFSSVAKSDGAQSANTATQDTAPDTRALAGAQEFSLGAPGLTHSFWQPFFGATTTLDTNPLGTSHATGLTTWTSLWGGFGLRRTAGRSDLSVNYDALELVGNQGNANNALAQEFQFADKVSWRRTTVSFFDQLSYLPETARGGGLESVPHLGGGELSLQPGLILDQSILTTFGQRVTNSFVTEVDRYFSARSSLSVVGSYSLLRFTDNNFLNLSDAVFQAGYNHQLNRKETIALLYRFSAFRYDNVDQSIDSHIFQVAYGRRIMGRLAFELAAGPELGSFRLPITASGAGSPGGTTSTPSSYRAYWTLDTSMVYQKRRTQFGLAYDHSLSGGGGVLVGAVSDQVSASVNSEFRRTLTAGVSLGYARNEGLSLAAPTSAKQSFNYWFGGVNVSHPLGRSMNVFLSYRLQFQSSNGNFCVGISCGQDFLRHTVSVGFAWSPRPIPIG